MAIKDLFTSNEGLISDIDSWRVKREDIKQRLFETIGLPPGTRNTRDVEIFSEDRQQNYIRYKIKYVVGDNDIINAYLLRPYEAKHPSPAILAMHQTVDCGKDEVAGIDGHADYAYGHELAMNGFVVLVPDYLTAGERIFPGEGGFVSTPFYKQHPEWSMVGKNLEDSMSAVDVLCTLDYVDNERIAAIGHSHGGHNAIFAMAIDDRIKVGVSNCGMSVFSEEEERLEWSLEEGYIYIPKLRKYFLDNEEPPFDINEIASLIAPRPWLNISSYYDMAYGNQDFLAAVGVQLNQVYKLHDKPGQFAYLLHNNDHSFPQHCRALAYAWIDRFLRAR